MAIKYFAWHSNRIYKEVKAILDKKYSSWYGLTDLQIMNRVRNIRKEVAAVDIHYASEQPHIGMMKDLDDWFMQVNYTVANRKTYKLNRITVYGNPYLFGLLKGSVHLHLDAIFFCCPKGYEQMLVVMVFDEWTETYVDVLYILMSGK